MGVFITTLSAQRRSRFDRRVEANPGAVTPPSPRGSPPNEMGRRFHRRARSDVDAEPTRLFQTRTRFTAPHDYGQCRAARRNTPLLAGFRDRLDRADVQAIDTAVTEEQAGDDHAVADVLVERLEHELQRVLSCPEWDARVSRGVGLGDADRLRSVGQRPLPVGAAGRKAPDDASEGRTRAFRLKSGFWSPMKKLSTRDSWNFRRGWPS